MGQSQLHSREATLFDLKKKTLLDELAEFQKSIQALPGDERASPSTMTRLEGFYLRLVALSQG